MLPLIALLNMRKLREVFMLFISAFAEVVVNERFPDCTRAPFQETTCHSAVAVLPFVPLSIYIAEEFRNLAVRNHILLLAAVVDLVLPDIIMNVSLRFTFSILTVVFVSVAAKEDVSLWT